MRAPACDPLLREREGRGEHHRTNEQTDDAKADQPADHAADDDLDDAEDERDRRQKTGIVFLASLARLIPL